MKSNYGNSKGGRNNSFYNREIKQAQRKLSSQKDPYDFEVELNYSSREYIRSGKNKEERAARKKNAGFAKSKEFEQKKVKGAIESLYDEAFAHTIIKQFGNVNSQNVKVWIQALIIDLREYGRSHSFIDKIWIKTSVDTFTNEPGIIIIIHSKGEEQKILEYCIDLFSKASLPITIMFKPDSNGYIIYAK